MAENKKIEVFNENGKPTAEGQIIISDGAYLADMAYKDKTALVKLSQNQNNGKELTSKDGYIIIKNPHTGTKFEVVEVHEGSYGLNLSTFKKEGSSEYFFAGAGIDGLFDGITDALYLLSGKNIQSAEAISYMQSKIKETRIPKNTP